MSKDKISMRKSIGMNVHVATDQVGRRGYGQSPKEALQTLDRAQKKDLQ